VHPAEHRVLRELYAFTRQLGRHWASLGKLLGGAEAAPLQAGAAAARELLDAVGGFEYDERLIGGTMANFASRGARARPLAPDAALERNQALRFAVSDVQHVVTLLGFLEQVARSRGDDSLRAFCSEQRARLMPVERTVRAAAIELGSSPDEAIEPLDRSAAGRVAHGAAYAFGSVGEWFDRRAGSR